MSEESVLSASGKRWSLCPWDERLSYVFTQRFGVSEIVGRIMAGRGLALEKAEVFLTPTLKQTLPDPFHLKDMDVAIDRLIRAIQDHESIVLLGDYDVDGATSTSLLYKVLTDFKANVSFYIPDRLTEGYGPKESMMDHFKATGVSLVVTLDCGTTAYGPFAYAKSLGLDVIVIDHHGAEWTLPDVVALVNPNRLDESSPLKHLAAVGLAFMVAVALVQKGRTHGMFDTYSAPDLLSLLDLVALGTVCDVMPLEGLNRTFVTQGLKVMAGRTNIGLKVLADMVGLDGKPTPYHLGFMLGPRINAAGRIGTSSLGTQLLTTSCPETAKAIAIQLQELNAERQALEKMALEQAFEQAEDQKHRKVMIVSDFHWHPGVVGIIAGRLKDSFHRPCFCLVKDLDKGIAKGSGRSIKGFDLGQMVHGARQRHLALEGGGHAMAAGITLSLDHLEAFQDFLEERLQGDNIDLVPRLAFDAYLTVSALNKELCQDLSRLEPYGHGHPTPKFCLEGVRAFKVQGVGVNHLRLLISDPLASQSTIQAMAFRAVNTPLGDLLTSSQGLIDVVGTVQLDTWGGQERLKVMIEDARPHRPSVKACSA